ncbi:nuclear transport factor 2 family protein [uncultured Brevundimonas sp.]|uniref:nuclear transport factor 2 family protein n=1 Tax=uncultured Brevundimonas sp. TaxID=213418 RepID=UPI0030EDEA8D|tara:strand:+ start:71393 stop:71875 length:483 start_codon:yes stop_codon:yes gene_type:complete
MFVLIATLMLTAAPQTADTAEQAAVSIVIDRMHAAASRADGADYFAQFTPDARFIGTDSGERWSLVAFRAYAEPFFARGQGWTYVPHDRVVTIAPIACRCVAWFDERLDNASYGETRGSGVLRLTDDGWKIEQYVLSFAVPNDAARDVVALIRQQTVTPD